MTKLKLTYFPAAGRAEPIRLTLAIGGVEFEDERIVRDEFVSRKPSLPFGSLPVLDVDGSVYSQSHAILRYAGKLAKLYPEDPLHALRVDEVLDGLTDALNALVPSFRAQDDETKKRLRTEFLKNEFPRYFGGVEKLIAGPFVLGDKPSIADVAIYTSLQSFTDGSLDHIPADSVNAYPKMVAVAAHVKAMPAVQARLQAQAK